MPRSLFKASSILAKEWPEVFEDLYISTIPAEYLNDVYLEFHDGRIWEIQIDRYADLEKSEILISKLFDILEEYQTEIVKISFSVNVDKLKQDIKQETKNLLKS